MFRSLRTSPNADPTFQADASWVTLPQKWVRTILELVRCCTLILMHLFLELIQVSSVVWKWKLFFHDENKFCFVMFSSLSVLFFLLGCLARLRLFVVIFWEKTVLHILFKTRQEVFEKRASKTQTWSFVKNGFRNSPNFTQIREMLGIPRVLFAKFQSCRIWKNFGRVSKNSANSIYIIDYLNVLYRKRKKKCIRYD